MHSTSGSTIRGRKAGYIARLCPRPGLGFSYLSNVTNTNTVAILSRSSPTTLRLPAVLSLSVYTILWRLITSAAGCRPCPFTFGTIFVDESAFQRRSAGSRSRVEDGGPVSSLGTSIRTLTAAFPCVDTHQLPSYVRSQNQAAGTRTPSTAASLRHDKYQCERSRFMIRRGLCQSMFCGRTALHP